MVSGENDFRNHFWGDPFSFKSPTSRISFPESDALSGVEPVAWTADFAVRVLYIALLAVDPRARIPSVDRATEETRTPM